MSAATAPSAGADAAPGFEYLRRTRLEHETAAHLRGQGFEIFRTDGRQPGVSLIALRDGEFRFVCVRRRRHPAGSVRAVAEAYAEDLGELRRYRSATIAAELWIWCSGDGWRRFTVYPGGLQETTGPGA